MCRKVGLISLITLINLIGRIDLANSEEISRNYELKVKLKPKVIESRVYCQGREKINWQKEIDNWHFGLLLPDKIIPPLIIDKENFYPTEKDYSGRYFWGKNNMRLLVFNPLNTGVQVCLEFFVDSFKKDRDLEIWLNGKMVEKINVPTKEGEFSLFKIENISLEPGINEITFFCPEGTDELKPKKWEKEKEAKEVSIKFKEFKFGNLKTTENAEFKKSANNVKYVLQDDFLDIIFSTAEPVIFSREMDVNLEEFPLSLFNLEAEFKREANTKLMTFLGIDYTGDELIDEYLSLEDLGEHNLFELAKDKWKETKDNFRLKRLFSVLIPEEETLQEEPKIEIGILRLRNIDIIDIYNDDSLLLVRKEFNKDQLRFEDINVKSQIIEEKSKIFLMGYFDAAPFELRDDELIEEEAVQYKKRESEETRVYISLDRETLESFPYFSFKYDLENPQIQDVEIAILIKRKGKERILDLTESQYQKSKEEVKVNLKELVSERLHIKNLIIRLKRRDDADCSLPEKRGWYQFQLSDLKLYEKFPYPVKSEQLKERFLSLIQTINPGLLEIDEEIFRLNDFEDWQGFKVLERDVLLKRIDLRKGKHKYEKLENSTFDVEWVILEPEDRRQKTEDREEPEITFKKINPTKYRVKIEGAKEPFWLVFSESFHKQWRAYVNPPVPIPSSRQRRTSLWLAQFPVPSKDERMDEIIAEYPKLGVKEARHLQKFTPQDIEYLFRKEDIKEHYLVNGYANAWYIDPKEFGLGEDFVVTLYFWPQSLFYLGLFVSGVTFIGCIGYLGFDFTKRKFKYAKGNQAFN